MFYFFNHIIGAEKNPQEIIKNQVMLAEAIQRINDEEIAQEKAKQLKEQTNNNAYVERKSLGFLFSLIV